MRLYLYSKTDSNGSPLGDHDQTLVMARSSRKIHRGYDTQGRGLLIMDNLDRFYIAFEDGLFALVIDSLTDKIMGKYPVSHIHLAMVQVVDLNNNKGA
jgi:hypothetical protein